MYSFKYKGYYIQGKIDSNFVDAIESETGYGYTWKQGFKSVHSAKIAITKRINKLSGK
jgi:hypothetical protein